MSVDADSQTNELFIRSAKYFAALRSQEGVKVKEFIYLIWSHLHSSCLHIFLTADQGHLKFLHPISSKLIIIGPKKNLNATHASQFWLWLH